MTPHSTTRIAEKANSWLYFASAVTSTLPKDP